MGPGLCETRPPVVIAGYRTFTRTVRAMVKLLVAMLCA